MKIPALITFAGFYESLHDSAIDDVVEQSESYSMPINSDTVIWSQVRENYARFYADLFLSALEIDGEFQELTSPREYNFETDKITVLIESEQLKELFERAKELGLAERVKEEMQERSGFIPYYSDELDEWGPVEEWAPAQLELVLRVLADEHNGSEWDQQAEYDLMETTRCNGYLDNWIYGAIR